MFYYCVVGGGEYEVLYAGRMVIGCVGMIAMLLLISAVFMGIEKKFKIEEEGL